MPLHVPRHSETEGNECIDVLARERNEQSITQSEPPISLSLNVSGLKVKKWLKERHSEHWAAHTKYKFIEWPSDKVVD
jgi:hypothetical protein